MGIGFGVVLIIIGAILSFAVKDAWSAVDLTLIGYILMGGGLLVLLLSLLVFGPRTRRARSTIATTDAAGRQSVTDRDDRISGV